MRNPLGMKRKFGAEQEEQLDRAQKLDTRARIYELGVSTFLRDNMSCAGEVEQVRDVLSEAVALRAQSLKIHDVLSQLRVAKVERVKRLEKRGKKA